jgi:hypothetical protein
MGLRFFCVGRWGSVRGNAGLISESAHPPEKSAVNFRDTSIHRLVKETLRRIVRTRD